MPPRRTCRPPSSRRNRNCRWECRARHPTKRLIPPISRFSICRWARPRCRFRKSMSMPRTTSASASRWSAASPKSRSTARRSMRFGSRSIQVAGVARYRHRRGRAGGPSRQRRSADGNPLRPASTVYRAGAGTAPQRSRIRPLIVTYRNGSPVRLADVGRVIDSVENDKTAGWTDGLPSVVLAIQRQPGVEYRRGGGQRLRLLPSFQAEMPAGLKIGKLGDRATTIGPRSTMCNSPCC